MQWLKWFINTGETLLEIPHPRAHAPQYPSLSLLSNLFPIKLRGLGVQSYKLLQLGHGQSLSGRDLTPSDVFAFWTEIVAFSAI